MKNISNTEMDQALKENDRLIKGLNKMILNMNANIRYWRLSNLPVSPNVHEDTEKEN